MTQELHLLTTFGTGDLWHTIRHPDGTWERFGDVRAVLGFQGFVEQMSAAGIGSELQVVMASGGRLYHTIRYPNATWQPYGDVTAVTKFSGLFSATACASIDQDLHVCGLAGRLFHTIRRPDGSWYPFGDVNAQAGDSGQVLSVFGMCGLNGDLHIVAITNGGPFPGSALIHTTRHVDGSWSKWENLSTAIAGAPAAYLPTVAAVGANLQLAFVPGTPLYPVFHSIHQFGGGWSHVGDVYLQCGNLGGVESVGVAGVNGELQLAVVSNGSFPKLWHTIRHANGKWQPFGDVSAATRRSGYDLFLAAKLAAVDVPTSGVGGGGGGGGGGVACYPGTPGWTSVEVQNGTGDDVLTLWQLDSATGTPSIQATLAPGESVDVQLTNCYFSQLIAVSQNWVVEYNDTFLTNYDPNDWGTAQTVNFQRWTWTVLGRSGGSVVDVSIS